MVFSTEILIQGQKKISIFFFFLTVTGYKLGLQFLIYLEILMSYLHTILWTSCFPNHIGEMQSGLPHRETNAFFLRSRKSILNLHSLNSVLVTTKLQCFLMEEINMFQ